MFLSSIFSKCDGFEQQVKLSIEKDDSVKTGFGGLLTIAALTATIVLAANTVSDYLYHTNPDISFDYDYFPDPGYLDLNSSNFLFSITNQDADYFLDSAMVSFNLIYVVQKRFENGTITRAKHPIPLVKCTREYWAGFESDYDSQNMANRLCPSVSQYNISGNFLSSEYVYLQFEVQKCKNRTDQPDIICKPKEELDAILPGKEIAISLMYTDNIFNLNEWENPVKRFVTNLHWNIAPEVLSKKTDVFVSQYDIITDDNFLMNGYWERNHSTYQINSVSRDQNYAPEPGDVYMKIYLRKSSSFTTATRQFLKSGDVLESIGGLAGFWFTVLGVFAILYNKRTFHVKMANSLYEFDKNYDNKPPKDQDNKEKTAQNSQSNSADKNLMEVPFRRRFGFFANFCKYFSKCSRKTPHKRVTSLSLVPLTSPQSSISMPSTNLNPVSVEKRNDDKSEASDKLKLYLKYFQNYTQGVGKKMTYSCWDFFIGLLTCRQRKKDKLISLAAERLEEDTDIINLLKRIQDLEKLKSLLLNEHQLRVFSHKRPPLISLEEEDAPKPLPKTPPQQRAKGSKQSLINKLRLRRKSMFRKEPLEDVNTVSKFALLFDSYRKLRKEKDSKLNRELIRSLDLEMEQILYNLDFELKVDETFDKEYFKIVAMRALEDLLFQAKKKTKKMGKADAADIIARRWLMLTRRRKAREVEKLVKVKTMTDVDAKSTPQEKETTETPANIRLPTLKRSSSSIEKAPVLLDSPPKLKERAFSFKERQLSFREEIREEIKEEKEEDDDVIFFENRYDRPAEHEGSAEDETDEIGNPTEEAETSEQQSPEVNIRTSMDDGSIHPLSSPNRRMSEDTRIEISPLRPNEKDMMSLIEKNKSRFLE